ncbi:receptor-like protein 12 [Sorghum bicolor]|uniref:receptor-like protein 12 n=1 Tax=Sorghum bicolor TaxID=4558 RepID=UPI000B425058|nr:receptor-like protein 12 [Sorghum bicolor]|eukprot:XP_021321650.1 receptor-like protein 12 [Sorghum bicolor]
MLLILLQIHTAYMLAVTTVNSTSLSASPPVRCLLDQASALLELKESFNTTGGDSTTFLTWTAETDCCSWHGVSCGSGSAGGHVTSLNLGGRQLQASGLDPALFRLTSLKHLDLSGNDFSVSQLPATGFERLTQLTHLDLSDTNFAGPVPASIGRLKSLIFLDLSTSFYAHDFDDENRLTNFTSDYLWQLSVPNMETLLADLTNLEVIRLGMVNLSGNGAQWCNYLARFSPKLKVLSLPYCLLPGPICRSLSALTSLTVIELHYNHLSGPVPEFLVGFSNLTVLQLSTNKFEGYFPSIIFKHKKLQTIDLSRNPGISGVLPAFSQDSSLEKLFLNDTKFSGTIPSSISNLKSLKMLGLGARGFSGVLPSSIGKIPPQISNLTRLQVLLLQSNNFEASCRMSSFPSFLRHLDYITGLDLSDNQIYGAIPQWIWGILNGSYMLLLNVSHNKFTSIGSEEPLLPVDIEYFDLSFNNFSGPIPIPRDGSVTLDYSSNQFSSMPDFSNYLSSTLFLKASRNSLSENISQSICGAVRSLLLIDLSYNKLSGSIPPCLLEDASALQVLSLQGNRFVGELPDNISKGCALEALDLSGNLIDGRLPRSLVSCRNLEILDIGSNQISDSFPCWMSTLPKLQVLILKSNKFTGQLLDPSYNTHNANECEFTQLRIVDMASNNLSGTLSAEWFKMLKSMKTRSDNETLVMENQYYHVQPYQFTVAITYKGYQRTISKILTTLVLIDISKNSFYGTIPEDVGDLLLLSGLNMSHNTLEGPIPVQFGRLKQLESLDLSSNELSGEIPQELASLNFLSVLNLSYNMLVGRIPESSQFSTFPNSSFLGNTCLCGPPMSKQCSNTTETILPQASEKDSKHVLMFMFTALGFGVFFSITVIVIWGSHSRKQNLTPES